MKREKIFLIISCIAFIQPNCFVKINALNYLTIGLAVICLGFLLIKITRSHVKLDRTFIYLIFWRGLIFLPTYYRGGEIIKWGYQSVVFLGLYLLVRNYINSKENFRLIYKIIFSYILLNIGIMVIYPNGIFPEYGIHFLGIRTRFSEYSIALIYIAFVYYWLFTEQKTENKRILILSLIIAVLNIAMQWVVTGIIVIILIVALFWFCSLFKKVDYLFGVLFLAMILITINVVNGNLLEMFSGVFELLNKDITLTGRTLIWDNALGLLEKYFLVGYGYVSDGNIVPYSGGLWQAHNGMLQLILESGIFGAVMFYCIIFKAGYTGIKNENRKIYMLNVSIILGFMVMMISEILYYYPVFIFVLFLIGNTKRLVEKSNDNK